MSEASVSSIGIVVSFIPGLNGGYPQTITAHYKRSGDEQYVQYSREEFVDPQQDSEYEFRFDGADFQSGETYEIFLRADNDHPDGQASESSPIMITMPGNHQIIYLLFLYCLMFLCIIVLAHCVLNLIF